MVETLVEAGESKPDDIKYWVDDHPPASVTFFATLQQFALLGSIMTLPIVFGRSLGLGQTEQINLVALTMIAAGVGVILQTLNRGGVGVGLFVPMHTSAAAFPAMGVAVGIGGLSLAFGMLAIVGLVQLLVSRIIVRLKEFIPVEIAGLAVFTIGIEVGLLGLRNIFGIGTEYEYDNLHMTVGLITLGLIIVIGVWAPVTLRAFAVFVGLVIGQLIAILVGLVRPEDIAAIWSNDLFSIPPIGKFGWSMDWSLVPDFALVGVALSLNCFGIVVVAQKSYNSAWSKPDLKGVQRGLMAEGMTNILTSFLNGITQTSSGPAVGLALTSGIVSRIVGFVLGGVFIVMSFFPPVTYIWNSLSTTVVGAILIFIGVFITITGIRVLTLRLLDNRRTIALGLGIIGGVGYEMVSKTASEGSTLFVLFSTPLAITLSIAIVLNALFLIYSRKKLTYELSLDPGWNERLDKMMWSLGAAWGASPETVERIIHSTNELIDVIASNDLLTGQPEVYFTARFFESGCSLRVMYNGTGFKVVDTPPSPERMLDDPDAVTEMAGYLVHRIADGIKVSTTRGPHTAITLSFNDA